MQGARFDQRIIAPQQFRRLVRLLPDWHATPTQATLVMPSRRLVPTKLRALIDHLQAQLSAL